jgi:hypothetical protein
MGLNAEYRVAEHADVAGYSVTDYARGTVWIQRRLSPGLDLPLRSAACLELLGAEDADVAGE